MQWLKDFEKARGKGAHTFLFTGSVSDGFPAMTKSTETDPVDLLEPWHTAFIRHLEIGKDDLVWVFDPALGFHFPSRKDCDSATASTRFRSLAYGEPDNAEDDVIAQAARDGMQEARLPRDPREALELMYTVFRNFTPKTSKKSSESGHCIAIIPDLDTICSGSLAGANAVTEQIALLLVRIAENDQIGRMNHLLLMSAKTVAALPKQLHTPESPIIPLVITPPGDSERLQFIAWLTNDENSKASKLAELEKELQTACKQVREQLAGELSLCETRLQTLRGQTAEQLQADPLAQKLTERILYATDCMTISIETAKAAYEQNELALRREILELEQKIENDPELQPQPLNNTRWRTLHSNDLITLLNQKGDYQEFIRVLTDADEDGDVHLTDLGRDPTELQEAKRTKDGTKPVLFNWSDSDRLVCRATKDVPHVVIGYKNTVGAFTVRRDQLIQLQKQLEEMRQQLEQQKLVNPPEVQEIQKDLDRLNQELDVQRRTFSDSLNHQETALEEERIVLQSKHDKPSSEEIIRLQQEIKHLQAEMKKSNTRKTFPVPSMGIKALTRLTGNLSFRDIAALFREAGKEADKLSITEVTARRIEMLNKAYGDLLEIENPPYGFDGIAGLEGVKEYFKTVVDAMNRGDTRRVPMGCLLMGPPGTGKSAVATALAREANMLLVKISAIRSKYVGESEQNQERLFQALKSLAPIVVFRDEIDQEDQSRDGYQGDSGVSNRMRQGWMQFLSDPTIRGHIFVVSATNRPDLLDNALTRAGRTDDRIPILMPDHKTRTRLFPVMMKRHDFETNIEDFGVYAEQTEGLTGADIEVITRKADRFGAGMIHASALTEAVKDYIPSASKRDIANMTLLAIKHCSSRQFLPDNSHEEQQRAEKVMATT